jgi:hypothetical protein
MPISRSGRYALFLVSAVALAGCGSTVQSHGQAANGDALPQVPTATAGGGDVTVPTDPTQATVAASPAASTPTTSTASTSRTTTQAVTKTVSPTTAAATSGIKPATGTVSKVAVPATGRGWDKEYVYIGVITQKDVNAAAKQLGLKSIDGGDQEGEATAMANAINAKGGIWGRKIKIAFHDIDTTAALTSPDIAAGATCQYYAQDRPVVAVLSPAGPLDVANFRSCLAKNKIALFSVNTAPVDNVIGQSLAPYYYSMAAPSWNSFAPALVSTLASQHYFTPWNTATNLPGTAKIKVGILIGTTDVEGRIGTLLSNTLKDRGIDTFVYANDPKDFQGAVLKMSGSGVTHLIFPNGSQAGFLLTAASQSYFPRYGLSSANAPQAFLEQNVPQAILHGAVGAGWSPSLDVADANDPGDSSVAETNCRAVFKNAGFDFTDRRLAEAVAYSYCDGMRIIANGAQIGGGFTPLNIYAGVVAIAPTFKSALSFGSGLNATHLTVPGAVRPFVYSDPCKCFRYTTTTNTIL